MPTFHATSFTVNVFCTIPNVTNNEKLLKDIVSKTQNDMNDLMDIK